MSATLLVAAGVIDGELLTAGPPYPRCVLLDSERIDWVGDDPADAPPHGAELDLAGCWITPAFVDAHVHATATGLAVDGVRLSDATGAQDVLQRVRRHEGGPAGVILGSGWEEFGWTDRRLPSAAELSEAAGGGAVLLTRVDAHSCLVSTAVLEHLPLDQLDGVERDAAGAATGWLREQASEAALTYARALLTSADLHRARHRACTEALRLGIGAFHEMGHPGLSGLDDARAWVDGSWPLDVATWWAELDLPAAQRHGMLPGGDLFLDGSIGSCTAATVQPYGPQGERGVLFHADEAVAAWFSECTAAGLSAGVHAIGERAIEQALTAVEAAVAVHGHDAVAACRHRFEHVELPTPQQVERMAAAGVVASIQPAFDAVWGGTDGLYADHFGGPAATRSNPFAWFASVGATMAFGSDSTVTPLDALGTIRAAMNHRGGLSVTAAEAVAAHTIGGRYVANQDDVGRCTAGQRADLAVWSADPLSANDVRCLATIVRGVVRHDVAGVADVVGGHSHG